jgi:hypothetical protein
MSRVCSHTDSIALANVPASIPDFIMTPKQRRSVS